MSDEKSPHPGGAPDTSAPSVAPPLRDAESNRQVGEGRAPQAAHPIRDAEAPSPEPGGQRAPNIGDAHAPVSAEDVEDRPDKNLYDRLADKDVTPTGESGSGLI